MGRRALGPLGAFLPNNAGAPLPPEAVQREAVRRLERAGYQAVWNNEEVGGKDGLVQLAVLLAANARQVLGPDKLLVVGLTAAVDEDPGRARATARQFVSETVRPGSPYAASLARLGYAEEDISAASDKVVDAIVAWGRPEQVLAGIRRHLDAGADHVRLGTIAPDFESGLAALEQLASALTR